MNPYVVFLLYMLAILGFVGFTLLLNAVLGPKPVNSALKMEAFECGATPIELLLFAEEYTRTGAPPMIDIGVGPGLVGPTLIHHGTEAQKKRFLDPILRGDEVWCQGFSEPQAGSDLASLRCRAERDGDEYVINGQKIFVGSDHGTDRIWMIAVTNPGGKRHENLSWFMIDADRPGITVQPMELMGTGGEGGTDPVQKNTVFFDQVRVPAFSLIGGENNGWKAASTHLELEHGAGGRIGRNRVWDRLLRYCQETKRDGIPLAQHQDVRDAIDQAIRQVESGYPDPKGMDQALAKHGLTRGDLEELARALLLYNVAQKAMGADSVTDQDLRSYYDGHQLDYTQFHAERIVVNVATLYKEFSGDKTPNDTAALRELLVEVADVALRLGLVALDAVLGGHLLVDGPALLGLGLAAGDRDEAVPLGDDLLDLLAHLGLELLEVGGELVLEHGEVGLAVFLIHRGDDGGREVKHLLEVLGSDVEQVAHARRDALEVPDVADGRGELDVAHALAADLGASDLDAAALAHDALEADTLVLAAVALPVLRRTEDLLAEESVLLGLERAVVDSLRLLDLATGPLADLLARSKADPESIEVVHIDVEQRLLLLVRRIAGTGKVEFPADVIQR